jgi:hypothetical protein
MIIENKIVFDYSSNVYVKETGFKPKHTLTLPFNVTFPIDDISIKRIPDDGMGPFPQRTCYVCNEDKIPIAVLYFKYMLFNPPLHNHIIEVDLNATYLCSENCIRMAAFKFDII